MRRRLLTFVLALATWFSSQSGLFADEDTKLQIIGFWTANADWKVSLRGIDDARALSTKKFGFPANTDLRFIVLAKGTVLETSGADLICRVSVDLGALTRREWKSCDVSRKVLFDGYRQIDELTVKAGQNSFIKTELSVIDANSMHRLDSDYSISVSR